MRYQAYVEYKDSEVELLGDVPIHWEVKQLKRTVNGCLNGVWGSEPEKNGDDTIVLRVADFNRQKLTIKDDGYTYRSIRETDKTKRKLKYGDLLLEKSGGGEKTLVGQVVLFDKKFDAVTSNFVAKMSPIEGYDSKFLNYVFARFYAARINYCSIKQNTGIQNLDSGHYLAKKFAFPDIEEQKQIAAFLDRETAVIDTLIAKQEELIGLLKEKRTAVISTAVTKGINPHAPLKDSGIEWLGQIPTHWGVTRVGYFSKVVNGSTPSRNNSSYWTNGVIPWISSGKVNDYIIDEPSEYISEEAFAKSSLQIIPNGALLIGMVGQGKTRGLSARLNIDATINQNLAAIIPNDRIDVRFLHYYFQAIYTPIREFGRGGQQSALNCELVRDIKITLPTFKEQEQIADYLDQYLEKLTSIEVKGVTQIVLLRERRTALISAAVTGKIDVRQA